jgi:lipid II:glycine glycyltransferase (peptidoglycan interpeptide bridge formation enzyme)
VHREVMPSNLMMWEMITWAQEEKLKTFDMWGSLGANPDKKNPWFGFHRFKEGYGGELHKFVGTFDLILKEPHYQLFSLADNIRWKMLRAKTVIGL